MKTIKAHFLNFTGCFLFLFAISPGMAQNLALHKDYRLSIRPNYRRAIPHKYSPVLTDGIIKSGLIDSTTAGWRAEKEITIDLDLGEVYPISSIGLHAMSKTRAGVSYPRNIYVFISRDNLNFSYVGDAALGQNHTDISGYVASYLVLRNIDKKARFVSLVVVPQGKFIFCNELKVTKGPEAAPLVSGAIGNFESALDSLKKDEFARHYMKKVLARLARSGEPKPKEMFGSEIGQGQISDLWNQLAQSHARFLKAHFKASFEVEKVNPWDTVYEIQIPKKNASRLDYDFQLLPNNAGYGAFAVTNSSPQKQVFLFTVHNKNPKVAEIELFLAEHVYARNYERPADALVPIDGQLTVAPGKSALVFFKLSGLAPGQTSISFPIRSRGKSVDVRINTKVLPMDFSENVLSANVWAYLNKSMLMARPKEAAKDLEAHHINTIVVPPRMFPKIGKTDFAKLAHYLKNFKKADYVILFMAFGHTSARNGYKSGKFMSGEWKTKFAVWHKSILEAVAKSGLTEAEVLLYPYDEIHRNEDIQNLKKMISWTKAAIPETKYYVNFTNPQAIKSLLSIVDIAQFYGIKDLLSLRNNYKTDALLWQYLSNGYSRSMNPYSFYRLKAWRAFDAGLTGIGFWNYASEARGVTLNLVDQILVNPSRDFSVVYNRKDGSILSSRRWEAFRLGIEDYAILVAYAKRFGRDKAEALVASVIDNPNDVNRAEEVRDGMLKKLR